MYGHFGAVLLLAHHPSEVLFRDGQQAFQLTYPVLADVSRCVGGAGAFKQPDRFLVIGFGHVKGVLESGFVLQYRVFFHATSVVPIPG